MAETLRIHTVPSPEQPVRVVPGALAPS